MFKGLLYKIKFGDNDNYNMDNFLETSGQLDKSINYNKIQSLETKIKLDIFYDRMLNFQKIYHNSSFKDQINKIFEVSTCRNSCCGCLRPPCGGTEATVPSINFKRACCTPSPHTSRVMNGLSDLREILSISSI